MNTKITIIPAVPGTPGRSEHTEVISRRTELAVRHDDGTIIRQVAVQERTRPAVAPVPGTPERVLIETDRDTAILLHILSGSIVGSSEPRRLLDKFYHDAQGLRRDAPARVTVGGFEYTCGSLRFDRTDVR